jgi:hypothetical protein
MEDFNGLCIHTLGVNVVETPETNCNALYDEWLGSA